MKLDIDYPFKEAVFNRAITSSLPSIVIISLTPGPCCKQECKYNNNTNENYNFLIINLLAFSPLNIIRSNFIKVLYTILFDLENSFNSGPNLSTVKTSTFIKCVFNLIIISARVNYYYFLC